MDKRIFFSLCVALLLGIHAGANVTLPLVLGDNMVLQRGAPVAIWGTAAAGEKITVSFAGQRKQTAAAADGRWMVKLDPMAASETPHDLTVAGSNTLVLKNVLVGEVWLCSGQSNMEYTMMKESKFAQARRSTGLDSVALKAERNPLIRLFLVKRDLTKPDGAHVNKGWNEAEGEALRAFSAAGYFFAKNLYASLHVPVGVISSAVPGSAIEPWMSGDAKTDSLTKAVTVDEGQPGKFYTGMIQPLAPFALKGFLWYQGETNCFLKETTEYTAKFKHLIQSWRQLWNEPAASFYFVQIAPFEYSRSKGKVVLTDTDLPAFRHAQAAALSVPHTGMVVTTDLADDLSDIHPTYKWEIGRRLALLALAKDYSKKLVCSGPLATGVKVKNGVAEISFDNIGKGLQAKDSASLGAFELAGADGVYYPAVAKISGEKVVVKAAPVPEPASVRFAWRETAQPNFFNRDGLPAAPFVLFANTHLTAKNKKA